MAAGEIWRLWTVTLVHAPIQQMPLHLLFNMYALYLAGPFVERLYGRGAFLLLYLACAAGGSLASFAFGDAPYGVGASGAIFGLFGLLIAVQYVHQPDARPPVARRSWASSSALVILNLILGFTLGGIDNWAHIGGLVTGLWIGRAVRAALRAHDALAVAARRARRRDGRAGVRPGGQHGRPRGGAGAARRCSWPALDAGRRRLVLTGAERRGRSELPEDHLRARARPARRRQPRA